MSKVVFINPLADFGSNPVVLGTWNTYFAPELLQDFFEGKGIESDFVNLNDLFIKKFFSEDFCDEFFALSKKYLSSLEKKENMEIQELIDYLPLKFMVAVIEQNKNRNISVADSVAKLLPMANLLMNDVNILQPGTIKVHRDEVEFNVNVANFDRVMGAVLKEFNFENKLLVFSVPSKAQMSSVVQTGRLVKSLFPSCKVLIGGSYVKFTSKKILDELVDVGFVDFFIKDADESKLLSLAREFLDGSLGDFSGSYDKSAEQVTINDLVRKKINAGTRQELLLSNGCYWGKCRYCEFPIVRKGFTVKKTNVIVDEIEHFYKQGVRNFRLLTDCLVPAVGVNIAKELLKRGIKIRWDSGFIRIDSGFTKEVILLLKESGFQFEWASIGMESCVDAALMNVDKGYNRKIIEAFFDNFRALNIKFSRVNIIFNIPGTTAEDLQDMKKFILELFDVCNGFLGHELFLSDQVELGMHPEKYNIQVLGVNETNKDADTLLFNIGNELLVEDKNTMKKFFRILSLLYSTVLFYRHLDVAKLARTRIYSEKDFRLLVKTGNDFVSFDSVFDEDGKKIITEFIVPRELKEFNSEAFFLFKIFDRLEKDKWYSVGDIVDVIGYSSPIDRMKLMQRVFHGVIAILASKGFADVKIDLLMEEKISE